MADQQTVDWILATIRQRESGGNYTVKNRNSSASGAYQFIDSTWRGLGGGTYAPSASQATPEQQDEIARKYVESILANNGDRIDAVPRSWYVGNPNAPDSMQPGGPGNEGVTVGRYVSGWMSSYSQVSGSPTTSSGGGNYQVSNTSTTADTRTPEQYAMETYGYMAAFLQHPEIGPILRQAAQEQWSQERLRGALYTTNWWNTSNESSRTFDALQATDPVQAQSRINASAASIVARANQLGYPTTRERAEVIAKDAVRFGWQGAELDNAIGMDAGQQQILTSSFGTTLRQTASAYGLPMSDVTIGGWAQRIAGGQDTEENFVSYARQQAMNLYPTASSFIQNGGSVQDFFDPYRQIAAKTLQIAPDTIDLSDPKWGAAFSGADEQGNRRPMRTDEWQKMLMTDERYGYKYTKNANDTAEDFVGRLKTMFGASAG